MGHMVNKFIRYLHLWLKMAGFSMQMETEYRGSFLLEVFVEIGFFIVTLASMAVIYSRVSLIAGWNQSQIVTLMGINMIFSEVLLGLVFVFNLRDLPYKIVKGDLDLILTKPIDSQFMVSLWRPYFASVPSLMCGLIVAVWGFSQTHAVFYFRNLAFFLLAFVCGLIIAYSLGMTITTLSMWFINATSLPFLAQQIIQISGRPSGIFINFWRLIFLFVVPIIFMVSLPTEILIGKTPFYWSLLSVSLAIIFLYLSRRFWHFALRHYSSASS
jgi:ABC-2 type transport system permease protein